MDNKAIYKKTIGFSLWRVLWDLLATVAFFGFIAAGVVIADKAANQPLIGLAIGAVLGGVASWLILHFVAYTYKAGQIAMMTEGVTTGKLPENTIAAGRKVVKERFATVTAYYLSLGQLKVFSNKSAMASLMSDKLLVAIAAALLEVPFRVLLILSLTTFATVVSAGFFTKKMKKPLRPLWRVLLSFSNMAKPSSKTLAVSLASA